MSSQSNRNLSYKFTPRTRSQKLLGVILDRILKPCDADFAWDWHEPRLKGRPRLYVKTTTAHLSKLCNRHFEKDKDQLTMTPENVGEILRDYWGHFLGILEDKRQAKRGRNAKYRQFVLTLWSEEKADINLKTLETLWQEKLEQKNSLVRSVAPQLISEEEAEYRISTQSTYPSPDQVLQTTVAQTTGTLLPTNLELSGAIQFIGRDQQMTDLHQLLGQEGRVVITAVSGMAGVGKTELALQYGQQHLKRRTYPGGICWFQSRELDMAGQIIDFAQTHLGLNVPDRSGDTKWSSEQRTDWCWRNWQPSGHPVLIILDDVTRYSDIEAYLPRPSNENRFKILMTSRNQDLGGATQVLVIEPLSPQAALKLLQSIVGKERIRAEAEDAEVLCQWLGNLPLGIELVGRYLRRKEDLSLAEISKKLESTLLSQYAFNNRPDGITASRNLLKAFGLSWQELNKDSQQLACLLSLFAMAPIPWPLVELCFPESEAEMIEEIRDHTLINLSLLKRSRSGFYKLHPLIREFFKRKSEKSIWADNLKLKICESISIESTRFPLGATQRDLRNWDHKIPHIKEVAENLSQCLTNSDLTFPFGALIGFYTSKGLYDHALPWAKKCVEITKIRVGKESLATIKSLENLASVFQLQREFEKAKNLFDESLKMQERLFGGESINLLDSINGLAAAYRHQGRYEKAEALFKRALKISKQFQKDDLIRYGRSLNNLAELYSTLGFYVKAETLLKEALGIFQQVWGDRHPHLAFPIRNLAEVYFFQNRFSKAEPLYKRALSLRRELLGNKHLDFATSLDNLASIYIFQGRHNEAELLASEGLETRRSVLGNEHLDVADSLSTLGQIYRLNGDYDEAENLLNESLRIRRSSLDENHPNIARGIHSLGSLRYSQNRYEEAISLIRHSLDILRFSLGESHLDVAETLSDLGNCYFAQKRYDKAKSLYEKALRIRQDLQVEDDLQWIKVLDSLVECYCAKRYFRKAESLYHQLLSLRLKLQGEEHPNLAANMNDLALIYGTQGRFDEAEPLLQKALSICRKIGGEDHNNVTSSICNLADLYCAQGQHEKAESFLKQNLELRIDMLGEDHLCVAYTIDKLVALYLSQSHKKKAKSLLRKAFKIRQEKLGRDHSETQETKKMIDSLTN